MIKEITFTIDHKLDTSESKMGYVINKTIVAALIGIAMVNGSSGYILNDSHKLRDAVIIGTCAALVHYAGEAVYYLRDIRNKTK